MHPVHSSWSFLGVSHDLPSSRLRIAYVGKRVPGSASCFALFHRQSCSFMFMKAKTTTPLRVRTRARSLLTLKSCPSLNRGADSTFCPSSPLNNVCESLTARILCRHETQNGPRVSVAKGDLGEPRVLPSGSAPLPADCHNTRRQTPHTIPPEPCFLRSISLHDKTLGFHDLLFARLSAITSKQAAQVTARLSWDPAADIFHAAVNEQTWPPQGLKITGGQLMQRRTFFKGLGGGLLAAFAGPDIAWGQSRGQSPASTPATAAVSAFPVRTERRGALLVTLGPVRVVMRGPMFPVLARLGGDTIVLSAQAVEEGGPLAAIRSDDLGKTWRATGTVLDGMGLNTHQLRSGKAISHHYDTKPPGATRWRRTGVGSLRQWKTVQGPSRRHPPAPPDSSTRTAPMVHGNTL